MSNKIGYRTKSKIQETEGLVPKGNSEVGNGEVGNSEVGSSEGHSEIKALLALEAWQLFMTWLNKKGAPSLWYQEYEFNKLKEMYHRY